MHLPLRENIAVAEGVPFPLKYDDCRKILKGNGPPQSANKDIRDPDFPDSTSNDPYLVVMALDIDRLF